MATTQEKQRLFVDMDGTRTLPLENMTSSEVFKEAGKIAQKEYEDEWGIGSWGELDKYAREDYTFFEYDKLLKEQEERRNETMAEQNNSFLIRGFERGNAKDIIHFTMNGQEQSADIWQRGDDYYYIPLDGSVERLLTGEERQAYDAWLNESRMFDYYGIEYRVVEKWEADGNTHIIGYSDGDDGTWYAGKVVDTSEDFQGTYDYEFGNERPTRNEVEEMHLNHISEIAIDRHEAEFGADGSRAFPNLNEEENTYRPMELRYYEPDLGIDGTADEMFIQARNGYIENVDTLRYLQDILARENKSGKAERIGYMIERELEDTSLYSIAQMKLDFLDNIDEGYHGGGIDEVEISDNTTLSVMFEPRDNNVVVSVNQLWQDGDEQVFSTGATTIPFDEFKGMTRSDFESRIVGGVLAYSMQEVERTPNEERPFPDRIEEQITLHFRYDTPKEFNGFTVSEDRVVFNSRTEMEAYVNGELAYDHLDNAVRKNDDEVLQYAENANGEIVWGTYPIREFFRADNGQIAESSTIPALHLIEAGLEVGQADRTEVYNAVREFEQRNSIEFPVIDSEGRYEDKDFLYDAYDRYVAFSHGQELSKYEARLDFYDTKTLAEIYYGIKNGLNEQQIDGMIAVANIKQYNAEMLRVVRYGYQAGHSEEQVAIYSNMENSFVAEAVKDFIIEGATKEQIDAVRNLNNQSTAYAVIEAMREGMSADKAKIIVDNMAELHRWNEEQWRNQTPTEIRSFDYEGIVNSIRYTENTEVITNDTVSGYIDKLKVDRRFSSFAAYVEEANHREDAEEKASLQGEKNMNQNEKKDNLTMADEELSPRDKLQEQLTNGVRSVLESDNFKNWLSTGGKLFYNNYSFRNAMLVWLQKPDATYVMGYEKWKDFGRNVAQGAQGAKVFVPIMAYEKQKGGLFRTIKSNLNDQLLKNPSLPVVSYRLGSSSLEFTMNRANHLIGLKVNGKEQQIFGSDDEVKRFIDRAIIGKVATGFTVGTVFDYKDVIVPEHLWVKSGYKKDEVVLDSKGNPTKNRKGEVKIVNTPERQARFNPNLDTRIAAGDPVKMQYLFDACVAASERKGVPVSLADKEEDTTLGGGAKGYFSRKFTEDKPKGFIVIDKSLEITERCAVLLHEMGHADLHSNLEKLAQQMGEKKIPREMREIQAEATAYAVASTFGIETDTSSFAYLAAYTKGFDLQDFQKSLEVIFKESQTLTADIKAELDLMGLNLDLTKKAEELLRRETLQEFSTKYMDFATEQGDKVQAALVELPSLVKQSAGNAELMDILKYQKANLDEQKTNLDGIYNAVEALNTADTREKQEEAVQILDTLMNRVNGANFAFEHLTESYMTVYEQSKGGLKVEFEKDPLTTLETMKKDFPALAKLSTPQLQYIATSKFVAKEFTKLLRKDPQEFVDSVTERAALLSKAASKNGTFVEINFCEQWTEKPFFEGGLLCSPKIADKTVTGCEAQARGFANEAEKRGEYFPYTKCDMTIFTPSDKKNLISINTRVDIGDGKQTSLKDHMEQICQRGTERKEVLANFSEALSERADKRKMVMQDLTSSREADNSVHANVKEGNLSKEEWDKKISDEKTKATGQEHTSDEKQKNKGNKGREE